jgi:hypothetical protein
MKISRRGFLLVGSLASAAHAEAPLLPTCELGDRVALVERLDQLPADARAGLQHGFAVAHGIAEVGAPFAASDSTPGNLPEARFIRAYRAGDTWMVWFERGGVGLGTHTVALGYRTDEAGNRSIGLMPGGSFAGDLCAGTKAYFAGVRSAG